MGKAYKIVLWAAVALIVGGCARFLRQRDGEGASESAMVATMTRAPQVLHVLSSATWATGGCGFALSPRTVLTASHVCDEAMAATVDGSPMVVVAEHARLQGSWGAAFKRGLGPYADDWVVLGSTADLFSPDPIALGMHPEVGQRVLLGGYPCPSRTVAEFERMQPTYEEGVVVDAPTNRSANANGVVWVYVRSNREGHGFSGGPAAIIDNKGNYSIWGIVVGGSTYYRKEIPESSIHMVVPLPRELARYIHNRGADAIIFPPPPAPVPGFALQTLHVVSEAGAAGWPVDARTVIVCGAQLRGHILAASVDDRPMVVVGDFKRLSRVLPRTGGAEIPCRDDWVLLSTCVDPRLAPNLIDPAARPAPGAKVVVGGFVPPPTSQETPLDFLERKPSTVEGRVLDTPARSPREEGAAFVAVPPGDYSGFLGGPVATVGEGSTPFRVWGIVVAWDADDDALGGARLVVAPLSNGELAREPRDLPRVIHYLAPPKSPATAPAP